MYYKVGRKSHTARTVYIKNKGLLNVFSWVSEHFRTQYEMVLNYQKEVKFLSLVCKIMSRANSLVTRAQRSASWNPIL